jgi:hypothetical protein
VEIKKEKEKRKEKGRKKENGGDRKRINDPTVLRYGLFLFMNFNFRCGTIIPMDICCVQVLFRSVLQLEHNKIK